MNKIAITTCAIVLLGLLAGCPLVPPVTDTGALRLSFSSANMNRVENFVPPVNMTIASYDVQGSGPGGASFQQLGVTGASLNVGSLVTGPWTVNVDARNPASTVIAAGATSVTIAGGQTASATVTVAPLPGNGALNVSVSWPAGLITSPGVSATLTPQGGAPAAFSMALAGDSLSASGSDAARPAGYYTLSLTIVDGAQTVYGLTDVVRIVAGNTTTAAIVLTASDIARAVGGVTIAVTPDLRNPVTLGFTGQQALLAQGSSMTVVATPSQSVASYQWFLNGVAIAGATGASVTLGSALPPGGYSLDLVVAKPDVLGAGHVGFRVAALVAAPTFSPPAGTYTADQSVTLSCATTGAAIHYTTDGSTPTAASPAYSTPIGVAGSGTTMTIKAFAVKAGMIDSAVASAAYSITNVVYSQPPAAAGGLIPSSRVDPDGSNGDVYAYDSFVLAADTAIREVRWRGGYAAGGAYGMVTNFRLTFYASTANDTQPLANSPDTPEVFLADFLVGGNAGETAAGSAGGVAMYDYVSVLPTTFPATAGVKYWLRIEAYQAALADWGISTGTGGNGSYYRFTIMPRIFATIPGQDTSFSLVK